LVRQLDHLRGRSHPRYSGRLAIERRVLLTLAHLEVLHLREQFGLVGRLVLILGTLGNRDAIEGREHVVLVLIHACEWQYYLDRGVFTRGADAAVAGDPDAGQIGMTIRGARRRLGR